MFSVKPLQFLHFVILGGSLKKVELKIVNTILGHSLSPVLQTPNFCEEFSLFLGNAPNKVNRVFT